MGEGIKFLGGKWMNIESEKNIQRFKVLFLAVQDSSIGDLVTD